MAQTIESVEAAAMQLSPEERLLLAERLVASVPPDPEVEAAWDAEIARRIEQYQRGELEPLPGPETLAQIKAEFE